MPRDMAATVLGAGGSSAPSDETERTPAAPEPEPGGPESEPSQEDSADGQAPRPEGTPPESEAPEGDAPPADKRLRDTQAALHRATAESKKLAAELSRLMPSAPADAAGAPPSPPRPQYAPPPPDVPTRQLPSGEIVLDIPNPIGFQDVEAAFQANSDKSVDDRTAFHRAFGGLIQTYHTRFMSQVVPRLQRAFMQGTARELQTRQARAVHGKQVQQRIEGFWKQMAPQLPARAMWSYAQEAITAHPGQGSQAITQQALYCLSRALEDFRGAASAYRPDTNANRAQDALLRPGDGGGGRPMGRPGSRPGVTNMVDQIKASNRGLRT